MASRLLFLAELLTRGAATRTSTAPNSWAAIALWRRFFQIKDKEEEEKIDEIAEVMDSGFDVRDVRPIASSTAVESRTEFSREYLRDFASTSTRRNDRYQQQQQQRRSEDQIVNQPNLRVPTEDNYMYLAQ